MTDYPAYIKRMLGQARDRGQWYAGQAEAAAICFEVLALYPDHPEAAELAYQLFCDEWLIYDTRNALQQQIDEWDDRPWQQRRRLALSMRMHSRWEGWHEQTGRYGGSPPDVAELLLGGHSLLIEAYCLGDEECSDMAWPLMVEAFQRTSQPREALLWAGVQYADLGFFADAVEVLSELCARFADERARRLLAEVRWWRDNAHRLPWLPPPGDGARYRRMLAKIDPGAPADDEALAELRARAAQRRAADRRPPVVDPAVARLVAAALPAGEPAPPAATLVDWSFLDCDDDHPGEIPEWAKKTIQLFGSDLPDDMVRRYRWSRPIPRPASPPRYDPSAPPLDLDDPDDPDEA